METARKEMETITAQRRVAMTLKHRTGFDHPKYEFGDQVRVYREGTKRFKGPYTVHGYDNNRTVEVKINNEIVPLSTFVVKKSFSGRRKRATNQESYSKFRRISQ